MVYGDGEVDYTLIDLSEGDRLSDTDPGFE